MHREKVQLPVKEGRLCETLPMVELMRIGVERGFSSVEVSGDLTEGACVGRWRRQPDCGVSSE